jgi:hypothetical protein
MQSMLRDVGHCIAHDARNRGIAFKYVEDYVTRLRTLLTEGGDLRVDVFFPIEQIIDELVAYLRTTPVSFDEHHLRSQQEHLVSVTADVLDGTTFELPSANAFLWNGDNPTLVVAFNEAINGGISIPAGVSFGSPMLIASKPKQMPGASFRRRPSAG